VVTNRRVLTRSEKGLYILRIIVYYQMKKTIKTIIKFTEWIVRKVLRWAKFHKPEDFCRSSYITNEDKYYFEVKDRIGLSDGAHRNWALYRRV